MKIFADFNNVTGKIKPMHSVVQAPMGSYPGSYMHYLKDAGIPYARLHDVGGAYAANRFVDIPNIFRNFDADETLPESYDFAFTDVLMKALVEQGTEPFFRLGVTIENQYEIKAYNIYAPEDFEKWARICEHIVRHYNEGWANGYHMNIKYWEIWNEPEGHKHGQHGPMWIGTPQQYFRLYEVTANHLKKCFGDTIKVGGYSTCDFAMRGTIYEDPDCVGIKPPYENNAQYHVQYIHDFLRYISSAEHKAPLNFFSWHSYQDVKLTLDAADYCRRALTKYGFGDVEDCLTEWNTDPRIEERRTPFAAAKVLAMMLGMQKKTTGMACFYDARIGASPYAGLFDPGTCKPFLSYFALMMFNGAYKLENEIDTASDSDTLYVCGAKKDGKAVLLLSNIGDTAEIDLDLHGVSAKDAEVLMISDVYHYSPTGFTVSNNKLTMPTGSCVEIRFDV